MTLDARLRLPPSWATTCIADVADVQLGKMLSPKVFQPGLVVRPYLRNENVRWGFIDFSDVKQMGFKPAEIERYEVLPGDLLVCEGGEPGRCAIHSKREAPLMYQKALHRVRPHEGGLSNTLLRYWLEHLARSGMLTPKIAQTTIQHLPLERIRALEIPLPPRREQEAIVGEIEQQLPRIEAGVADLERTKAQLARYRASVLKAACEGRLVPTEADLARAEGREFEPAEDSLTPIDDRRRRQTGKTRETEHDSLPGGWTWSSIGQLVVEPTCNGLSIKGSDTPPGVAALRLSAMSDSGFKYDDVRYLPIAWERVSDLAVREGDFFVSRGNGSLSLLGRGTLAQAPPSPVIFPDTMMRVRLGVASDPRSWVACIWPAPLIRRQIERRAKTTAGIWKISQADLSQIRVPLPPVREQHRIVAEVERRLSIADRLAATIDAALARAARLRQSILKRAFEGKLVAQDPSDEPASVLLERIRKERAAADGETSTAPRRGARLAKGQCRKTSRRSVRRKRL